MFPYKKLPEGLTHRHVGSVTDSKEGQAPSVVLSLFQSGRVGVKIHICQSLYNQVLQVSNTSSHQLVTYS